MPTARLLPLLVFLATVACFAPALENGFVAWDDDIALTNNPRFRGLSPSHLRWMFTTMHGGDYAPLTWLTYALDHAVWGMNPRGYHLTSIVLHGVNALLVFSLTVVLLRLAGARDGARLELAAAAGALFFAVHPLRVESVAWAVERRDVLCGLFYLLTLLTYLRMQTSDRRGAWLAVSLGCFIASLLSKASGMTLPGILLVLDAYPLRRQASPRLLLEKVPYLVLAVATAVMAHHALEAAGGIRPSLAEYGVAQRLAQAAFGLCFYVWKTVVPLGLSPLYPLDLRLDPLAAKYLVCGTLVVVVAALLVVSRNRAPWAAAAAAAYAIVLLPVLGFAQAGVPAVADRYSYLACLPGAILVAGALSAVAGGAPAWRWGLAAATIGVLAVLATLTARQTRIWKDSLALWSHAVRVDPGNAAAHVQRGWAKHLAGDAAGAIADYDMALRLDPEDALAYRNRGLERYRQRDLSGALADYSAAIRVKPDYASAYYDRAAVWQGKGATAAAMADYAEAIRLNPRDPRPYNNRGILRAGHGDVDGAIADYSEALRLQPDYVVAYLNRARGRRQREDRTGAVDDVRTAIRHAPPGSPSCTSAQHLLGELGVAEPDRPPCAGGVE